MNSCLATVAVLRSFSGHCGEGESNVENKTVLSFLTKYFLKFDRTAA